MKKSLPVFLMLFIQVMAVSSIGQTTTTKGVHYGSIKDIDDNVYRTVIIGGHEWMAENLRVKHYNDKTPIPGITDKDAWSEQKSGAYCLLNYDASNEKKFGLLYNNYAATDTKGLAPEGWHLPTVQEWKQLVLDAGAQRNLLSPAFKYLNTANKDIRLTGFDVIDGAEFCNLVGNFILRYLEANFLAIDKANLQYITMITLKNEAGTDLGSGSYSPLFGLSVRCIRNYPGWDK